MNLAQEFIFTFGVNTFPAGNVLIKNPVLEGAEYVELTDKVSYYNFPDGSKIRRYRTEGETIFYTAE